MNYIIHIFGLISFAGIISSTPIPQKSITKATMATSLTEIMSKSFLETSAVKDENNDQGCTCTPFIECATSISATDTSEFIDTWIHADPCPSSLDVCCYDKNIAPTEKYKPSSLSGSISGNHKDKKPSNAHNLDHTVGAYITGNEGDHTKDPNVINNVKNTKKPSDAHKLDHSVEVYITGNEGDHTKEPNVNHNVKNTKKPFDAHKLDHSVEVYITGNEKAVERPKSKSSM